MTARPHAPSSPMTANGQALAAMPCCAFVRMFKPQFAPLVEAGMKLQTVRPRPKRMPKPGDKISLREWTGKPYRSKQRVLKESTITKVESVKFTRLHRVQFEDGILSCEDEWAFAKADGFESPAAMFAWFEANHGLPFEGVVIHWHNAKLSHEEGEKRS